MTKSLRSEIACQPLGHAGSLDRRMARSHHGDGGPRQSFGIAAYAQNQRRIVDFFQARRVGGVIDREQTHASRSGLGNLVAREFRRLACRQGLRGISLDACSLQFGQRSAEEEPKYSTRLRDLVGPAPGISEMARHSCK